MGHLPLFGRRVHDDHDLLARTGMSEVVVQETDGIRLPGEVSFHHGGEITFDQRQMGQMIERVQRFSGSCWLGVCGRFSCSSLNEAYFASSQFRP